MKVSSLIAEALRTRKRSGTVLWRQFWQICYLRLGSCRLDPWEYYFFQVYQDRYSPDEKRRFIGWRGEMRLDLLANAHSARDPVNDKLAFHVLFGKHGVPTAKIAAVYAGSIPGVPGAAMLAHPDNLRTFLSDAGNYPLFIKPVRGTQGVNTHIAHDLVNGNVILAANRRTALANFIARLDVTRTGGILFQELLQTSPETEAVCGRRLTSVRIIVITTPAGPEILSAVWRVPVGANVTDNFNCGRNGNIIAGVDLASGRIQRIVRGIGWDNFIVERHPDTGILFGDLRLPDWRTTCSLCLENAALLPGLRLQHWDVALTDRGPVVLEVNVEGGMRTHQIVQQRGIYGVRLQKLFAG